MRHRHKIAMAILALVCASTCSRPHRAPVPREPSLLIDHASVIDPNDGSVRAASILIGNGRIVAVGAVEPAARKAAARVVDATGKFVVPGYNNMHSHVLAAPNRSAVLAMMLAEGVTGFRQMAGSGDLLRAHAAGELDFGRDAPALLAMPGRLLLPTNVPDPGHVAAEIARQKREGADFIKVALVRPDVFFAILREAKKARLPVAGHLQEGTDARQVARAGMASIEHLGTGDVLYAACSRQRDALIADASAHAVPSSPPIALPGFAEAIVLRQMKTRLINPAAFAPPENVARLQQALDSYDPARCRALAALFARQRVWNVPTLVRLRTQEFADDPAYARHPDQAYIPAASLYEWRKVTARYERLTPSTRQTFHLAYARQLSLTGLLADQGAPMMTGTDGSGQQPGQSLFEEFGELAKAGLTPLKILQMTTIDPARFLGRTATMGTVAVGRNADLVLLDDDPLRDVRNLGKIFGVVRGGRYHSRAELGQIRDRIRRGGGYLPR